MKFILADGEVKFLAHKVEYQERAIEKTQEFWNLMAKDVFISKLSERDIASTVTEYEQPTQDVIDKVNGKKFKTMEEAQNYINGTVEPTELETIALAVAELFELVGGGTNG
jgi:hypothetical protein